MKKLFRIAVVGPESTGKSDLAVALASHFKTIFVEEFARTYLTNLSRNYGFEDLLLIAKGQLQLEIDSEGNANQLLICDTELTVIKIWSIFKFGKCDDWILNQVQNRKYDLYLLTDIDLPWQYDPLREHPDKRTELFNIYKNELIQRKVNFEIVSGIGKTRIQNAIRLIEKHLN